MNPAPDNNLRMRRLIAAASLLVYCASCVVSPVVRFGGTPDGWRLLTPALLANGTGAELGDFGIAYLLSGWMGLLYGASCPGNLAWLANIGYLASLRRFLRCEREKARWAVAATLLLGGSFLGCDRLILSESGTAQPVLAKGIACYLWVGSFVILAVGTFLCGRSILEIRKTTNES